MDGQNSGVSNGKRMVCPVCNKEFGPDIPYCDADGTRLVAKATPPEKSAADRGGFTSDEMQQMLKQIFDSPSEQPTGGTVKATGTMPFTTREGSQRLPSKKQTAISILFFILSVIACFTYTSFTRVLCILSTVVWGLVIAYNVARHYKQQQGK